MTEAAAPAPPPAGRAVGITVGSASGRDWRPLIRSVGVVALLLLLVTILIGPDRPLNDGAAAPVTRGVARDGGAFDLAEWQGQPVFINVWATWCGPCLMELPELAAAANAHRDVRFVGLVVDGEDGANVDRVVARFAWPYPIVPIDAVTQHRWNATALPSSFLVDATGKIIWSTRGAMSASDLESALAHVQQPSANPSANQSSDQSATTRP